mmetsp:Transcript_168040/g.539578  ORF Transcript_168040/g.539578 Transcript_168040/m.539578 type:complete len:322 (+) Transcript_168040:3-968(+)
MAEAEASAANAGEEEKKAPAAAELAAAKRRALAEYKKAALARLAAEEKEAEEAAKAEARGGGGDVDGASPVADIDIVEFLRSEGEAVIGTLLAENKARGTEGVVMKAAVFQKRNPKKRPLEKEALSVVDAEETKAQKKNAHLPVGAMKASKGQGGWLGQGGADGGVTFQRKMQEGRVFLRPQFEGTESAAPIAAMLPSEFFLLPAGSVASPRLNLVPPAARNSPPMRAPFGAAGKLPAAPAVFIGTVSSGVPAPLAAEPKWAPTPRGVNPKFMAAPKLGSGAPRPNLTRPPMGQQLQWGQQAWGGGGGGSGGGGGWAPGGW